VLRGTTPPLLCDPAESDERLAAIGIAAVVVQHFDAAFASLGAAEFVERMRSGRDLAGLVMTPESAFGRGREGTVAMVGGLGARLGFAVDVVAAVQAGGAPISSSRIRTLLAEGRLARAGALLGRRPSVTGLVVTGDGRGRELGFPTANLAVTERRLVPAYGIYAARVKIGDHWFGGAVSIGIRPTFSGQNRTIEVYVLDYSGDLYDQVIEVQFVKRLRPEVKFDTVEALIAQMHQDIADTRQVLASQP
jgi:riboflavin kinase/FMN adenylyltransferase